ncbi:MAG: hypothetical protein WAZ12_05425 [Candidatus Absconditicoccaceae bacterium]
MKNLILLIAMIAMFSCSTRKRDAPAETKENYTIGLKCFITSDGKECANFRNGLFNNFPKGTFIVASVFQLGTDSVQIVYSSPEYGNGTYTWMTSIKHYNEYESLRIRTRVFEVKNTSPVTNDQQANPPVVLPIDSIKN